jgi:hypothetical protein
VRGRRSGKKRKKETRAGTARRQKSSKESDAEKESEP